MKNLNSSTSLVIFSKSRDETWDLQKLIPIDIFSPTPREQPNGLYYFLNHSRKMYFVEKGVA